MDMHLGEANYKDFGWFDKVKIFFRPTHIEHDTKNWEYIYYKVYRGRKVIISRERYR